MKTAWEKAAYHVSKVYIEEINKAMAQHLRMEKKKEMFRNEVAKILNEI